MTIRKNTSAFYKALAERESSNNQYKVNASYYLGLYQMGEAALKDAGYYHEPEQPNY